MNKATPTCVVLRRMGGWVFVCLCVGACVRACVFRSRQTPTQDVKSTMADIIALPGGVDMMRAEVPPTTDSASAYAFVATIVKVGRVSQCTPSAVVGSLHVHSGLRKDPRVHCVDENRCQPMCMCRAAAAVECKCRACLLKC